MTLKGSLKREKGTKRKENSQSEGRVRKWWKPPPLSTGDTSLESLPINHD